MELPRLTIVRAALEPEVTLMHQVLSTAHATADHQRFHNLLHQAEHPPTRVELLHQWCETHGLFHDALVASANSLCDPTLWSHLDPTEESAFHIFTSMLRPTSVQWDLVVRRCTQYPYKLFQLLRNPQHAGERLAESRQHPCLLDPLAKSFFEKYATVEAIQSNEAMEVLKVLGLQVVGHTWSTERLHSSHSRRSRSRIQTHTMQLPQVALWHQARAAPTWAPSEEDE